MKARLIITIKKIKNQEIDEEFIKKAPKLIKSTEKTIKILCRQIDKYFYDNKIHTITKLEKIKIGED